jgi:hypothetical protein
MTDDKDEKKQNLAKPLKPLEPAQELLLPDIYAENNWEPKLALEDCSPIDDEESDGFDPYDTAVLYKS